MDLNFRIISVFCIVLYILYTVCVYYPRCFLPVPPVPVKIMVFCFMYLFLGTPIKLGCLNHVVLVVWTCRWMAVSFMLFVSAPTWVQWSIWPWFGDQGWNSTTNCWLGNAYKEYFMFTPQNWWGFPVLTHTFLTLGGLKFHPLKSVRMNKLLSKKPCHRWGKQVAWSSERASGLRLKGHTQMPNLPTLKWKSRWRYRVPRIQQWLNRDA